MIENWTYHDKAYDDSSKNIPCTVDSIAQGKSYYCSQQFFLSLMIINQVISDRNYLGGFTDATVLLKCALKNNGTGGYQHQCSQ